MGWAASETGRRPIEQIAVGDRVWARDLRTGKAELRRVTGLFHKPTREIVTLDVDGTRRLRRQ